MTYETSSSLIPTVVDFLSFWLERRRRRGSTATTSASAREILQVGGDAPYATAPAWSGGVIRQISQLATLPNGWDTYGGRGLDSGTAVQFIELLRLLSHAVQSEPAISMTGNGGLNANWSTGSKEADIRLEPGTSPVFGYEDSLSEFEWDGPLMAADPRVEKWLWQASA